MLTFMFIYMYVGILFSERIMIVYANVYMYVRMYACIHVFMSLFDKSSRIILVDE